MSSSYRRGVSFKVDLEKGKDREEWIQLTSTTKTTDSKFREKKLNSSLYQLYGNSSPDVTKIDVVFFHGVAAGDYDDSWRATWMTDPDVVDLDVTGTSQVCWPGRWLGDEYPQSRILAASYDSSAVRTSSLGRVDMMLIAETLVSDLIVLGKVGSRPFVLVGHSLGSLVIKELIMHVVKADRIDDLSSHTGDIDYKRQEFLDNLRGCFFYSPPSHGVSFNVWQDYFPRSAGPLMEDLEILNSNTQRLNEEFRKWRHSQLHNGLSGVPVWAVWESHTSTRRGLIDQEGVVVSEASARFDVDNFVTVAANHVSVCMPASKEHDSRFLLLLEFLKGTFEEVDLKPSSLVEFEKAYDAARRKKKKFFFFGTVVIVVMSLLTEMLISLAFTYSFPSIESFGSTSVGDFDSLGLDDPSAGGFHRPGFEAEFTENGGRSADSAFKSAFKSFKVVLGFQSTSAILYLVLWFGLIVYIYYLEPRGNPFWLQDVHLPPQAIQIMRGAPRRDLGPRTDTG